MWGNAQQHSFDKLKVAVTTTTTLKSSLIIVNHNQPFVVKTYANDYAIGVVLSQGGRPILLESKKLDSDEKNYSTFD